MEKNRCLQFVTVTILSFSGYELSLEPGADHFKSKREMTISERVTEDNRNN